MNKKKITISVSVVVLLVLILVFVKPFGGKTAHFDFEMVKIAKGDVRNLVTATGTLQAIKTVEVGTQVSGVINNIFVDFNSAVKKGEVLAQIDKAPLQTSLANSKAQLDNAEADLTYQKANFDRTKALYDKKLVSQYEYDQAVYNYSKAQASVKMANTEYTRAKINLDYATITSPIDGVILNRAVDEGQTVAASFNTPTLFTIANDLTRMQVEANIDEADIGLVRKGQKVAFQVDAFPEEKFAGDVAEIRLQPITTSNVVTYTVIINAPNPSLKLMPGMTANITISVEEAIGVSLVASKALKFMPEEEMYRAYEASLHSDAEAHAGELPSEIFVKKVGENRVWVKQGTKLYSKLIEIGITDGVNTEVTKGLNEGEEVILSMTSDDSNSKAASSPFMPRRPGSDKNAKK